MGMPDRMLKLTTFLAEWWSVLVFMFSAVIAFIIGRERQRWKVDQLGEQIQKLNEDHEKNLVKIVNRVERLEKERVADAQVLSGIAATQGQILERLEWIQRDLGQKKNRYD